ncbi:MAG: hypothetical protein V7750_16510 [Sneathiella sp.]
MIPITAMVVIVTILGFPALGTTQEQVPAQNGSGKVASANGVDLSSILAQATKNTEISKSSGLDLLPSVPCDAVKDAKVAERCTGALFAYYDYYTFGLAHRQRVIWWQHISSRIIFAIVLSLVVVGVYFAWRQFSVALANNSKGVELPSSTVEIGSKGIKVSSPVLGIIILTLSLGFFYLYLVFVYPIVEIL